ncbi:MAG: tripartite tricarboxylate transporter substrate binding protein BugD [Hyphomicrobiales bacterium]
MKLPHRRFLQLAAGAAALPAASRIAGAQTYPARPITVIVPYAAGGPADALARTLGERMRATLGQTIVIENVTGASGTIGVGRAVRSPPDGYTLSLGHVGSHVVNGAIFPLPFDLLKDFEPIALLPSNSLLIVSRKSFPANDLKELIAWLKANPDKATAGTSGAGGGSHINGVYFQNRTDTRFQFVPYRGTGPAMSDLIAGQIDIMFDQASNSLEQVRGGTIKAYAVTSKTRLPSAPEIPTVDEAGLPGFYTTTWYGLWAPKGTPKDVVVKLNAAVVEALSDPAVSKRLVEQGLDMPPRDQLTPEALGAFHKAEIDKWWPIVKAANIKSQ